MNEPVALQWDYDRTPWDSDSAATTFSVGVYQWLPKASGRGLKKSKTIRVKEYVAEPDRVYEKAKELCHRLNTERVNADNPPAWLQKQYLVSKAPELVIKPLSDDLTGNQVRSVRIQVMKQHLLPVGFCRANGGTYVRECGNQIHLIDFQPAVFGHKYTVNLGFHYAFIPPFVCRKRTAPAKFSLLDCAFRARIGGFVADGHDLWFPYGTNREALREVFAQNAIDCLQVFKSISKKWPDPQRWLAGSRTGPGRPWNRHSGNFQLFLACIEIHFGQSQDAKARLKGVLDQAKWNGEKQFCRAVLKKTCRKAR